MTRILKMMLRFAALSLLLVACSAIGGRLANIASDKTVDKIADEDLVDKHKILGRYEPFVLSGHAFASFNEPAPQAPKKTPYHKRQAAKK